MRLKNLLGLTLGLSLLGGLAGCASPVGTSENALRGNGIDVLFVDYDVGAGAFTVGVELDRTVLASRSSRYLVAELSYLEPNGAGVSPFAAHAVRDLRFSPVGRDRLYTELEVVGPRPARPEDVIARVSANPTPHP